jgi:hypothetical protein
MPTINLVCRYIAAFIHSFSSYLCHFCLFCLSRSSGCAHSPPFAIYAVGVSVTCTLLSVPFASVCLCVCFSFATPLLFQVISRCALCVVMSSARCVFQFAFSIRLSWNSSEHVHLLLVLSLARSYLRVSITCFLHV